MTLPYDIQYFVDCALDNHDINPFCHAAVTLHGDSKTVTGIVEAPGPMYDRAANTCPKGLVLDAYAHSLSIPAVERRAMVAASLLAEPSRLEDLADCLAGWNYDDSTTGGALNEYFHKLGIPDRLGRDEKPLPRTAARLLAPSAIRRYVRVNRAQANQKRLAAGALRREPWPADRREADAVAELFAEQRRRYAVAQRRAAERMLARPMVKPIMRDRRKIARRSAEVAESVVGAEAVCAFGKGDPVFLEGHVFIFAVAGSPMESGHGAITVALLRLADRAPLAGLCLFFDATPALDQLAAIAIHVRAGEELDLLDSGNLYAVTADGAIDPFIAERMSRRRYEEPAAAVVRAQQVPNLTRRMSLAAAYRKQTQPVYLEAIGRLVWGRDYGRLVRFCNGETIR